MSGFGLQADFYNSLTPADIENKELKEQVDELQVKIRELEEIISRLNKSEEK